MKNKTVEVNGEKLTVRKLPIGKYAEFIKRIQHIPELIVAFQNLDDPDTSNNMLLLVVNALDDLAIIVELSTGVSEQKVKDEFGGSDVVRVLKVAFEINDIDFLKKTFAPMIKKLADTSEAVETSTKQSKK